MRLSLRAEIRELRAQLELLKASLSKENLKTLEERDAPARVHEGLPPDWEAEAADERRCSGLEEVDLQEEWRKLCIHDAKPPTLRRWIIWARRAYLDHTNQPKAVVNSNGLARSTIVPTVGTPQERARVGSWVRIGKWAPRGMEDEWGPAPDQPGCKLPPEIIAFALTMRRERHAA